MDSDDGLYMYQFVNKPALVASTSIFCGLSILSNLFFILIILLSRLRSSGKHLVILALCLVDLYDACAVWAPIAQFYSLETWIHDPKFDEYINYAGFYITRCLRSSLVIIMCVNALLSMFLDNKRFLTLMSVSMIFASTFYSLVFVLPSTEGESNMSECNWEARNVLFSVSFLPQVTILFVLVLDIIIVSCCCTKFFDDVTSGGEKRFPIDVVVASVALFVFTIPLEIFLLSSPSCTQESGECRRFYITSMATHQLNLIGRFVLPLSWLLCPDVRREITRICCCCRSPPAASGNIVRYNLQSLDVEM